MFSVIAVALKLVTSMLKVQGSVSNNTPAHLSVFPFSLPQSFQTKTGTVFHIAPRPLSPSLQRNINFDNSTLTCTKLEPLRLSLANHKQMNVKHEFNHNYKINLFDFTILAVKYNMKGRAENHPLYIHLMY